MMVIVLDTNVLVSANLKPQGLEAYVVSLALNQHIRWSLSEPIFAEYEEVLRRPELGFIPKEIDRFLARVRATSQIVQTSHTVTACSHEADNRFLECAEAAQAAFLITGNKRHFPQEWKTTKVVNAREFIECFAAQQSQS
jgi:uncharacterized protein